MIQQVKDEWRRLWNLHRLQCVSEERFNDRLNPKGSRKLENPGKEFFLKLARDVIRNVNNERDKNGHFYARKAMVRTGLSLNFNGKWEEAQLSRELQEIVAKHRDVFEGAAINEADVESESQ